MWELDHKEGWALKNWCFSTVVLEKTLESPFDYKEIKPVNPEGNLSWIFFGRTDAETEASILWSPGTKNWLIGKDPDAGKDWSQKEKRMAEYEIIGSHHELSGHEFKQALRNLESIFKSKDINLPTKVHITKALAFPVVMCRCASWTIKKAEHGRTDTFELWCWRRFLRVPLTTRRSKKSILKEISP